MKNSKKVESLEADYKVLFPQFETFQPVREWEKVGDTIREFTMYEDYPPAYSSSHTELISQL
jgi:hypothetical protein